MPDRAAFSPAVEHGVSVLTKWFGSHGHEQREFYAGIVREILATPTEITPEMIEAGIAAVRSIEYELWESRSPEKLGHLAVMIFRSMAIAGGFKELEH